MGTSAPAMCEQKVAHTARVQEYGIQYPAFHLEEFSEETS